VVEERLRLREVEVKMAVEEVEIWRVGC